MANEVSLPSDFSEGGQLFVRNATGLVREVSKWDALIMNTLGMNVALGAVFMLLQAPGNFPGGSMLLSIVIGTVVMAFTLLWVYAEFSAAMPRSGGDYVFVSRALHPIAGFLLSWSQGMWLIFFWIGFNAWFCLTFAVPVALTTIGAVTGHTGFITLSDHLLAKHTVLGMTTQWWVILIGAAPDLRLRGPADLRLAVVLAGPEVAVRHRRPQHRAGRRAAAVQERRHRRRTGTSSRPRTRA